MLSEFMTVEDAMLSGLIPDSYHSLFENYKTCDDKHCGAPLIINSNRTVMKCGNPNCAKILASRVLKVYNRFGLMNFGPKNVYSWVTTSDIRDVPEAIMKAPNSIKPAITNWLNSYHTPGEIIEMLAIPGIGSKATKMMMGINNFTQLQELVEYYGVQLVMNKCGIHGKLKMEWWEAMKEGMALGMPWEDWSKYILENSMTKYIPYNNFEEFGEDMTFEGLRSILQLQLGGVGKDAQNCAESLYTYWNELRLIFSITRCLPSSVETYKIIITGDITQVTRPDGSMFERQEFIDFVNDIALEGGIRYQNSTAFASSEFVIADYPSNTNKYRRGIEKGNLISSLEFVNLVKERVKGNE